MPEKSVSRNVVAKAHKLLALAEERAPGAADWVELSNALFGVGGAATLAFPTESDRTAFCKTKEYRAILRLMDRIPAPAAKEIGAQ
jgi:hypothetical protein